MKTMLLAAATSLSLSLTVPAFAAPAANAMRTAQGGDAGFEYQKAVGGDAGYEYQKAVGGDAGFEYSAK